MNTNQLREWLRDEGFTGLVEHLRNVIQDTRDRLISEGMDPYQVDQEVIARMFELVVSLANGTSITAAADQTKLSSVMIRRLLDEQGFQRLIEEIRSVLDMIRQKLVDAGMQPALADSEATDQLYEWALVAALATPRAIPPARPARHHPWLRLLKEGI